MADLLTSSYQPFANGRNTDCAQSRAERAKAAGPCIADKLSGDMVDYLVLPS